MKLNRSNRVQPVYDLLMDTDEEREGEEISQSFVFHLPLSFCNTALTQPAMIFAEEQSLKSAFFKSLSDWNI